MRCRRLDEPPEGWEELCRESAGTTALHLPALTESLAAAHLGLVVEWLALEADGRLLGGAPAMVERRAGLHWIHAMPFGLPGAPLCRAGDHAVVDYAVAEALEQRAIELAAVGGSWVLYRPDGPACEAASLEGVNGETRVLESALLELSDGLAAAWNRVDADARYGIRHARRYGVRFVEDPEGVEEAYTLHAAQARVWSGHRPQPLEMWRRLLTGREGAPAPARLFTVRDSGGMLAAVLTLVAPRDALAWLAGAHPAARARHAFSLLLWSVAEWCAANGVGRLNLGGSAPRGGIAKYKQVLGASRYQYPVRWIGPAHAGPIGRWVRALQDRVGPGRTRGEPA